MVARQTRPIVASARKVVIRSGQVTTAIKSSPKEERAWDVYDRLGEVHYPINKRADIARKIRYFLARHVDGSDEPEEVEGGRELDVFEDAIGSDNLRRIVSELVVHWGVPGRGYIVGTESDGVATGWEVYSTQELRKATSGNYFTTTDDDSERIDADKVWQVWNPHPRNRRQPDSPLFSVLEVAEELIQRGNAGRAQSRSRMPAGLFVVPDTLSVANDPNDPDDTPAFDEVLMKYLTAPVSNNNDASSVVPLVATAHPDDIKALKDGYISFAREWREEREQEDRLIRRIAIGLDLPPELLTGMGDVNHWQAWWVGDSAVHHHVDPTVQSVLDSLTVPWLAPILEASNIDPEGLVIWRDLSTAIIPTRREETVFKAYDRGLIGGATVRAAIAFDDDDAATVEDLERITLIGGADTDLPDQRGPALALVAQITPETDEVPLEQLAAVDAGVLVWTVDETQRVLDRVLAALADDPDADTQAVLDAYATRLETRIRRAQAEARLQLGRLVDLTDQDWSDDDQDRDLDTALALILAAVTGAVVRASTTPGGAPDPVDVGELGDIRVPVPEIRAGLSVAGGGPAVLDGVAPTELIGNGQTVTSILERNGIRTGAVRWSYGDPSARQRNFPPHQALDGVEVPTFDGLTVSDEDAWLGRTSYRPGDHKGCLCRFVRVVLIVRPAA
jgi:hypothetical protein